MTAAPWVLSLFLLHALPPIPAAAPAPSFHVALLYGDGSIRTLPFAEVAPRDLAGLDHGWIWSAGTAPRRFEPGAWPALEELGSRAGEPLRIEVHNSGADVPRDALLLAAPAEMWAEVPEEALPRWKVPKSGRLAVPIEPARPWRLRLLGSGRGSWWLDAVPGRPRLAVAAQPAADLEVAVAGREGEPLPGAFVSVLEAAAGSRSPRMLALAVSGADGTVRLASLPEADSLTLVVNAPSHAPRAVSGFPGSLPRRLLLDPGAVVRGRFVDERDQPVEGVRVRLESWLPSGEGALFARQSVSGKGGEWSFQQVPRGTVAVAGRSPQHAAFHRLVTVDRDLLDLGDVVLPRGIFLPVAVIDEKGLAVAGARLEARPEIQAVTDRAGLARLEGVPAAAALEVRAQAEGYLPGEITLRPPFPEWATLRLLTAAVVAGRLVDETGAPVAGGAVRIEHGSSYRTEELAVDGSFELALPGATELRLVFSSPATRSLVVPLPPLDAGEVSDLGELVAPSGRTAVGWVVDAGGAPVAGARIWTPRPSDQGPVAAWMQADLLATASDVEGFFRLQGLTPEPALLRIDAPGLARAHRMLGAEPDALLIEVGEIRLEEGAVVEVAVEDAGEGSLARLDLRGQWLDLDLLVAPVHDGRARFVHVPTGSVRLSVMREHELLCERQVEVPERAERLRVDCGSARGLVSGRVLIGGEPAGAGWLFWQDPGVAPVEGVIINRLSPAGARQQRIGGLGRPAVRVEVDGEGTFSSRAIPPGRWRVTWMAAGGETAAPQEVEIPALAEHEVVLELPGTVIVGQVRDVAGEPVAQARVRELDGRAFALCGDDGSFRLLARGERLRLQAQLREETSEVVEVEIPAAGLPEPVLLTLGSGGDSRLAVTVLGPGEDVAAGAFVFLEGDDGTGRVLTTDAAGAVQATFRPPYPSRLRAAAFHQGRWCFEPWRSWEQIRDGMVLELRESGELIVLSEQHSGSPTILAPHRWDLTALLTRLGLPPRLSPQMPLHLGGLPAGDYRVSLNGSSASVALHPGGREELELD